MTTTIRPFERTDWDCYSGAERFPDGSEPLITSVTIDGAECTMIGDAGCIQVLGWVGATNESLVCSHSHSYGRSPAVVKAIMLVIGETVTTAGGLGALGFTRID